MSLDVHQLRVTFGANRAVDDVSLSIASGEVVVLLGPSGCGKSTLLRAVAGLEPVAGGVISWAGADLHAVPVHRRGFGLLFQDGQLFPHRDVAGNVEFGLRMAGMPAHARRDRVRDLLELVGLGGWGSRRVGTLSGGEQQRVALARSLAPSPRLLLLDEPLSALDRGLRDRLAVDLRDILTRTGTTALYVTHDQDEAFTLADRVAVMDSGRLLQTAEPHELWRHPRNEQVAHFLGYSRCLPVAAFEPAARPVGVRPGQVLALRADSLVVERDGPLQGRVTGRHVTRAGASVSVDVDGIGVVLARVHAGDQPAVGATVRLRLQPGALAVLGCSGCGPTTIC